MKTNPALNVYDLVGMCMDFFEAGGETVGSTLAWLIMYLVTNQDVQEKCFEEIKQNLGKIRGPINIISSLVHD